MKTPQEKYENDPQYATLVNVLYQMILTAQFTPSELREAATFASIKYEMERTSLHIKTNMEGKITNEVCIDYRNHRTRR